MKLLSSAVVVVVVSLAAVAAPAIAQVEVTCPADITVPAAADTCSAVVEFDAPIVTGTNANQVVTITPPSGSEFPVGTTEVLVTVTEAETVVASCTFKVTVTENVAPVITDVTVSKDMLWPPNHKMKEVVVGYTVTDNCDAAPVVTLTVSSNEAEDAKGSGKTKPDWQVVDAHTVKLRAERAGGGEGRVYTITITAKDKSGNSASHDITVTVPHSRGKALGHLKNKGQEKPKALWL
jgi:hypothetical protein